MKHPSENEAILAHWLSQTGVPVSPQAVQGCIKHIEWLLDANKKVNLTAVTDPTESIRLHALDSLLALPDLDQAGPGLLVDIGTGGGFPGLPLALASGRRAVLLDSVAKKASALQRYLVTENLETRISVSGCRSEAFAREHPACAAVVVARAVAELPVLVELAAPILAPEGVLVAMKGEPTAEEFERGVEAGHLCGMELVAVRRYRLPGGEERRTNVTYRRTAPPKPQLPRREGMASKRPLA